MFTLRHHVLIHSKNSTSIISLSASPSCPSPADMKTTSTTDEKTTDSELSVIEKVGQEVRTMRTLSITTTIPSLAQPQYKLPQMATKGKISSSSMLTVDGSSGEKLTLPAACDDDTSYAKAIKTSASRVIDINGSSSCDDGEEEDTDRFEATTHSEGNRLIPLLSSTSAGKRDLLAK